MATAPQGLPIIDISSFLSSSPSPESLQVTSKAINDAGTNYGFFYLTGHGISISTLDYVISLARQFFNLPHEAKQKIKRYDALGPEGGDGARGYQGMGENVTQGRRDMHEAIDLFREWGGEDEEGQRKAPPYELLKGPNLWPEEPKELKEIYLRYIDEVKKVGEAVVRAMGTALGLLPVAADAKIEYGETQADRQVEDSEIFVRHTDRSFWVMRLIGYPALEKLGHSTEVSGIEHENVDEFSCGEHTDYGCVTLLLSDPTPGALQVKLKDGSWLNADPIPEAFVVNIGDMMERWTNGLWQSTKHRVIHRGDGYRVSVPFFFEPNFDTVVRPLKKCIKECGDVVNYGEVVYGEHLVGKVSGNFYGKPHIEISAGE